MLRLRPGPDIGLPYAGNGAANNGLNRRYVLTFNGWHELSLSSALRLDLFPCALWRCIPEFGAAAAGHVCEQDQVAKHFTNLAALSPAQHLSFSGVPLPCIIVSTG
jgi:hypothetical protein